jgi:dTDP-glucose 4,6-dehydratase
MSYSKKILITGGAGFIGTHVIKHFLEKYPDYLIVNVDSLTYAGNLWNLKDVEKFPNYKFERRDVTDFDAMKKVFDIYSPDGVIHLAAESHVDRSISNPIAFVNTNVIGSVVLLNLAKDAQKDNPDFLFYQVSTDEVYGSLGETGLFTETTSYDPRSPYSASKAAADHFVRAYYHTYGLNIVISNCSNNYGPYQFPEKLIPLMINNILKQKPLPIYGSGLNVRDWLWVKDHASAIDKIFHNGRIGETYNIGGNQEFTNLDLVHLLCDLMDKSLNNSMASSRDLIIYVKDRPGHDMRYAIDSSKLQGEMDWYPSLNLEEGLEKTINWYLSNLDWLENVTSGEYLKYYEEQYG